MTRRNAVSVTAAVLTLWMAFGLPARSAAATSKPAASTLSASGPGTSASKPASSTASGTRRAATPAGASRLSGGTHNDARLYMTWNAPWGDPRAVSAIQVTCGDTTAVDTLYLSFDPGKDAPQFRGVTLTLYVHPPEGSSLAGFWRTGGTGINQSPLRVIFDNDAERGFETCWEPRALGAPHYDFVQTSGRLRVIYANPARSGPGLKGKKIYGLARVLVQHPPAGSDGCAAPVCFEWFSTRIAYDFGEERDVNRGKRHVSLNSPDQAVCRPFLETAGVAPWSPRSR